MAAPMEKTRHAGIYKRGGRYVISYRRGMDPTCAEATATSQRRTDAEEE
jgi:hypothetical protein